MAERNTPNQEKKRVRGLDWFRGALRSLRDRNSEEAIEKGAVTDLQIDTEEKKDQAEVSEVVDIKEQIPFDLLIELIDEFSTEGGFAKALATVKEIDELSELIQQENPTRFIQNELFGTCHSFSMDLIKYLKAKGYKSESISEPPYYAHTIVKVQTDRGQVYVDPTIGQFIQYPHVFVGTKADLKSIFMDKKYRSLYGTAVIGHTGLDSREKWFDVLYGYLE